MTPAKINLTIYQGSTFRQQFQWIAGENPVDLTGYKARMQIRPKITDDEVIIELTTENGGIIFDDPANGLFTLYIPADKTAELNFKNAVYDIEFDNNGFVTRLFGGTVTLSPEVTR